MYRSSVGDVWQLGRHFIYCGNSENIDLVHKQVSTHGHAEIVFTDPPYRITNMRVSKTGFLAPQNKGGGEIYDRIDDENMVDFNPEAFLSLLGEYFPPDKLNAFIFCNKDLLPDYFHWAYIVRGGHPDMRGRKGMSSTALMWQKKAPIPIGNAHWADVEYLLYFRKNGKWNDMAKAPLANRKRVLPHNREHGDHPTIKPLSLVENQIILTTDVNDLVYDPYVGSGTTIIACEKTGRRCVATELMPKYCDVAISRWEGETGREAWRIHTDGDDGE